MPIYYLEAHVQGVYLDKRYPVPEVIQERRTACILRARLRNAAQRQPVNTRSGVRAQEMGRDLGK